MDINKGEVVQSQKPKIVRSVIRSCAKWNYDLVQQILDGKITKEEELEQQYKPLGQKFEDMVSDCFLMNKIAQNRRAKRLEAGSVMFLNREFTFALD